MTTFFHTRLLDKLFPLSTKSFLTLGCKNYSNKIQIVQIFNSFIAASSLTPPRSDSASIGTKAKESSDTDDSDEEMDNEEEEEDEEEEIPLDLEEVEAVSKKARQDEEIHSEHMQVWIVLRL